MTTNRLMSRQSPGGPVEKKSPQGWCDHYNGQLAGIIPSNENQVIRNDIRWVVGKDGQKHLEHVETETDHLIKRVKAGHVTQAAIDRLSFDMKRILWNRCLLNCDYGSPPRFWLVPPETAPTENMRTGLDWFEQV